MSRSAIYLMWLVMAACLAKPAEAYRYGFAHTDPPADDPYLVGKLGFSWSAPIYAGYLIVNGKYIDAPYVVEQRGYGIFVNGVFVQNAVDLRTLFPIPEPPPVTEDPGSPVSISRETSIGDALSDPMIRKKHDYWSNKQIWGQDRAKVTLEYYGKLPCISKVEQVSPGEIRITDQSGRSVCQEIPRGLPLPDPNPSDKELYGFCMAAKKNFVVTLKGGQLGFVEKDGFATVRGYPCSDSKWQDIFRVLTSESSTEDRVKKLRSLGILDKHEDQYEMPVVIRPTPQLWKRLSGDWSWTNDAPARIHVLTNGWRVIPPKLGVVPLANTNAPVVAKNVVATNVLTQTMDVPPSARVEDSRPGAATPVPVPKPRPSWPIAVVAIPVIGLLAWLALRNRR